MLIDHIIDVTINNKKIQIFLINESLRLFNNNIEVKNNKKK